jgi:hypothetical protein
MVAAGGRHGNGMVCVNRPLRRQGNGMVCVNRPLGVNLTEALLSFLDDDIFSHVITSSFIVTETYRGDTWQEMMILKGRKKEAASER